MDNVSKLPRRDSQPLDKVRAKPTLGARVFSWMVVAVALAVVTPGIIWLWKLALGI